MSAAHSAGGEGSCGSLWMGVLLISLWKLFLGKRLQGETFTVLLEEGLLIFPRSYEVPCGRKQVTGYVWFLI